MWSMESWWDDEEIGVVTIVIKMNAIVTCEFEKYGIEKDDILTETFLSNGCARVCMFMEYTTLIGLSGESHRVNFPH